MVELNESPESISASTSMLQRLQQVQRYSFVHQIYMDGEVGREPSWRSRYIEGAKRLALVSMNTLWLHKWLICVESPLLDASKSLSFLIEGEGGKQTIPRHIDERRRLPLCSCSGIVVCNQSKEVSSSLTYLMSPPLHCLSLYRCIYKNKKQEGIK